MKVHIFEHFFSVNHMKLVGFISFFLKDNKKIVEILFGNIPGFRKFTFSFIAFRKFRITMPFKR